MISRSKKKPQLLIVNCILIIAITTSMFFSLCIDQNRTAHWKIEFRDNCTECQVHDTSSCQLSENDGDKDVCLDIPLVLADKIREEDHSSQISSFSINKAINNSEFISVSNPLSYKRIEADKLLSSFFHTSQLRSVILLI